MSANYKKHSYEAMVISDVMLALALTLLMVAGIVGALRAIDIEGAEADRAASQLQEGKRK
jgi:hypothetical protein